MDKEIESEKKREKIFSMCLDLEFSCGFEHPGVTTAWFSDLAEAKRFLRQNTVEISRVYINKLEPVE